MKTIRRKIVIMPFVLLTVFLLSWDYWGKTEIRNLESKTDVNTEFLDGNQYYFSAFDGFYNNSDQPAFAAEEVFVKRIPGDGNHLLIMAYYSKNRYSGIRFTLPVGGNDLVFTDDGKNFDEKAGDGIYTARMNVSLKSFENELKEALSQMKRNKRATHFQNRTLIAEPMDTDIDVLDVSISRPIDITKIDGPLTNKLLDSLRRNSIFITDLKVVEDSTRTWNPCSQTGNLNGAWTFKTLFQQIASHSPDKIATDQELSDFVKKWLKSFTVTKVVNSDTVQGRPDLNTLILNPWLQKSKNAGNPSGFLDMRFAPFKLTSILNRFDLRTRFRQIPSGEGRFTFCAINSDCGAPLPFTFVVEYGIPGNGSCEQLASWASQWFNLKNYELGTEAYNQALQDITDQFTKCGLAPNKANQNCLNTVRTNDRAFSPLPVISEFREFRLNKSNHQLQQSVVAQLPADKYNAQIDNPDVQLLADYINARLDSIVADNYWIPDTYNGQPFLAGAGHITGRPLGDARDSTVFHWDASKNPRSPAFIQNLQTRQVFSLNTCTGCHSGELQTNYFHVEPVFFGTEANLSGFLTGKGQPGAYDADLNPSNDSLMVIDAALRPTKTPFIRMFNDILRRAQDLKQAATRSCGSVFQVRDMLMFQPTNSVH